ncbi:B- and T-lymphocyte attenuator-like [Mugil cephalus]|uniref:B- and T-lymphocyte attenuator-like n=1 Tax=Mugil cephalus TaxID=48193 RepID=UPI001FB73667|nr:B- and T-lymphocyte attenuator-like [Mugil cephalus]
MKSYYGRTVCQIVMVAVLVLVVDADSEESKCNIEIRVLRNTVYNATVGEDLRINCPVVFCNNSPPTVSWYKVAENNLLLNNSSKSHIKTEWEMIKELEGISFLVFTNILMNDSGQYQCHSGGSIGHAVKVSVYGASQSTTVAYTTLESEQPRGANIIWSYMYRFIALKVFVIILLAIYFTTKRGCKGKSSDTPNRRHRRSHINSFTTHIYENDC